MPASGAAGAAAGAALGLVGSGHQVGLAGSSASLVASGLGAAGAGGATGVTGVAGAGGAMGTASAAGAAGAGSATGVTGVAGAGAAGMGTAGVAGAAGTGLVAKVAITVTAVAVTTIGGGYAIKKATEPEVNRLPVATQSAKPKKTTTTKVAAPKPAIPRDRLLTEDGVADLTLQTTKGDLVSRGLLGPGMECGEETDATETDKFKSSYPDVKLLGHFYDNERAQIWAFSVYGTDFQFENGIRVGSKKSDLKAAYGSRLTTINHEGHGTTSSPGFKTSNGNIIYFMLDENDKNTVQFIVISQAQRDTGEPYAFMGC